MASVLASGPSCPRLNSQHYQKIFRGKIVNGAEVHQSLEQSGQWLDNVDRTHLVLASGELLLQKCIFQEPIYYKVRP